MKLKNCRMLWGCRRGVALLMVLGAITIIALLLVALLTLVRTENRSSFSYGDGVDAQLLADLPINLVISQLREATQSEGGQYTWASQPGMVRRFGTQTQAQTGRADLDQAFKLYSSEAMIVGQQFSASNEVPPDDWDSQKGKYVDLNEPVATFPISGSQAEWVYPIVDPAILEDGIRGFEVVDAPGTSVRQAVPMPVEWIYVLEDGQMAAVASSEDGVVRFSGAIQPSDANRIVGRVAFWTDDESSKVNINTASEGAFWDTPRANSHFDAFRYADRQPVRNEFQRYPGHPANTSLSPILGPYLGQKKDIYYELTPFVENGGSMGGTVPVNGNTPAVTLDQDRLYATVDEYLLHATSIRNGVRLMNHTDLTNEVLRKTRFFLTAHSRSPEVTLFDTPKINVWPIQYNRSDRNALDRLMAFCATIGPDESGDPYYFQRFSAHNYLGLEDGYGSSQSTVSDYQNIERNRKLYSYLQSEMEREIPGFGGTFAEKYPQDADQILTSIVDYCRSSLNTMAQGLETEASGEGYFYSPPSRTSSYDTVAGAGQVVPLRIGDTKGFGRHATISELALVIYPVLPEASLIPENKLPDFPPGGAAMDPTTIFPGKMGYRATHAKAFVLLEFITPSPGLPSLNPNMTIEIDGLQALRLRNPAIPGGQLSLNLLPSASIRMNAPLGRLPMNGGPGQRLGPGSSCAHLSLFQPFFYRDSTKKELQRRDVNLQSDESKGYAWHSTDPFPVPQSGEYIDIVGTRLNITIYNHDGSDEVQTIEMNFPSGRAPIPYVFANPGKKPEKMETSLEERLKQGKVDEWHLSLIRPGDVVRSVEARPELEDSNGDPLPGGDYRFYAAEANVPANWYASGAELLARDTRFRNEGDVFDETNTRFITGLRNGDFWQYMGHFRTEKYGWVMNQGPPGRMDRRDNGLDVIRQDGGRTSKKRNPPWKNLYFRASSIRNSGSLWAGLGGYSERNHSANPIQGRLYRDAHPAVPRGLQGALRRDGRPGDWDNGFGNTEDGPFINKPDESNAAKTYWNWGGFQHSGGYYSRGMFDLDIHATNHSPNRQIASPVMFGSLPTGVKSMRPWETLVFSPNPAGRTSDADVQPDEDDHYGFRFPRDHLLLDLFWMPVVEPYAISEPFSTAGKVNLNYEVMPFRYIKRRTGIHAVFEPIEMMAVPPFALARTNLGCIKGGRDQAHRREVRYGISTDPTEGTLRGFEQRFEEGDIFRSPSEVCEIFLVPRALEEGGTYPYGGNWPSYDEMTDWWGNFSVTGDNVREMPYNQIYPRVTTQSNTFRVFYRVQVLKKRKDLPVDEWREDEETVSSEVRGSSLIERFIDPNDDDLPDFADESAANGEALSAHYQYRVIQKNRFNP